jgi:flagellar basal-body rod modification protein FlgD
MVTSVSGTGSTANSAAASGAQSLAQNYDTFLKLLTTQLQHQDPLNPMDSDKFTSQLVAFSGVEQQIATNKSMEKLVSMLGANQSAAAVTFIGKTVQLDGDTVPLQDGAAQWRYSLPSDAASVTLTVKNSIGQVVHTADGTGKKGENTVTWDGRDANGNFLTAGNYTLSIDAKDKSGAKVNATTTITGVVSSVEYADGTNYLVVDGRRIPIDEITKVSSTAD